MSNELIKDRKIKISKSDIFFWCLTIGGIYLMIRIKDMNFSLFQENKILNELFAPVFTLFHI
jgi:hypothetical protein